MKRTRLLYILSPGYSGSTITNLLLATHPDVATIGERTYINRRTDGKAKLIKKCACGLSVRECELMAGAFEAGRRKLPWYMRHVDYPSFQFAENRRVHRRLRRIADRYLTGRGPSVLSGVFGRQYHALCEANAALIDFVLDSGPETVFLDSSKSTVEFDYFLASGLFDIVPIHLSRDGRAQFHSSVRRDPHSPPHLAAERYNNWISRIHKIFDAWEGPYVRLKYEDLCEDPLGEIRRVAREAGLDPDGMSLDFRNIPPHVIGNGGVTHQQVTEIKNEERWKVELTADQLAVFEEVAGDANRSLGYGV